jgi:predicted metalloprotease with PDZ domain
VQVKYGLISPEEYLRVLQGKMLGADQFTDNLAFTELSLGALDKHANQYGNVYEKGALISMCLDIKLRDLSNGKYGMQNLVAELGKKYGVSKSFKDEELFAEIVKMTYPEIGEFFTRHVSGTDPLPLTEIFAMVGVEYVKELVSAEYSLGLEQQAIAITQYEGKPTLAIGNVDALNEQGKALGFVKDDVLLKINGDKIPDLGPELGAFIQKQQQAIGEGKILRYTVSRNNTLVELAAPCQKAERKGKHIIRFAENPTPKQLALRTAWLKP